MSSSLEYLDQAFALGRKELDHLASGEIAEAQAAAHARGELLSRALAAPGREPAEQLIAKLSQLRSMQTRLTEEAKRLHAALRDDLVRVRGESKRLAGYKSTTKITPLFNRFVSKRG
jgi:hypothetical protein